MNAITHMRAPRASAGRWLAVAAALGLGAFLAAPASAAVCRVAPAGNGNGVTWGNAAGLQAALANSACSEIWLKAGRYLPGTDRDDSFRPRPGVALYGGFAGTETTRAQRDPTVHLSVLSGDIDANDVTVSGGITADAQALRGENANHVLVLDGRAPRPIGPDTVLDGLVITGGRGWHPDLRAGGLHCIGSGAGGRCSPTLRQLVFRGNHATTTGGALELDGSKGGESSPQLEDVLFLANHADRGGAIYSVGGEDEGMSEATLLRVVFRENTAGWRGGALYNNKASPVLEDVYFDANVAEIDGGAMFNEGSLGRAAPELRRVSFRANSARNGGAIYSAGPLGTTALVAENASFADNTALPRTDDPYHVMTDQGGPGGAIHDDGRYGHLASTGTNVTFAANLAVTGASLEAQGAEGSGESAFFNVIFAGGTSVDGHPEIARADTTPILDHVLIDGGCPPGVACTALKSGDPRLGPLLDNGGFVPTMLLHAGSAAVDVGDDATCASEDARGVSRPQGSHCDLGAVERRAGDADDLIFADGFD